VHNELQFLSLGLKSEDSKELEIQSTNKTRLGHQVLTDSGQQKESQ
jgi:hypothetical protein